jgi:acyl-coenzyme A synthetase/AMP-(fatty) acid ligase
MEFNPLLERYKKLWNFSIKHPEKFWGQVAKELKWFKEPTQILKDEHPYYYWFPDGKINITYNIFDAHPERKNQVALIWESESGESKVFSYGILFKKVQAFARGLKKLGIKKGDVVTIYMPLVPEAMIALLAIARIGAIHNVVFTGFGKDALLSRIKISDSKLLIGVDIGYRRGKKIDYFKILNEIEIPKVILKRDPHSNLSSGVKLFEEVMDEGELEAEETDALDPLFILFTSGTTGLPKGVCHLMGSYTVWAYAHVKWLFGFTSQDVFFSTVDIGWINGHSYGTYGPLLNGTTVLWYEGVPNYPDNQIWWKLVEKYGVTKMWVAPTAIHLIMTEKEIKYDLNSLKLIVSAGEALGEKPWEWLVNITQKKCYIVETWGQTENSGYITSPLGFDFGGIVYKRNSVGLPLPGINLKVVDDSGNELPPGEEGYIVIASSCPAFMCGLWKNEEKYKEYYEKFGVYLTGDYGYVDEDGFVYIRGRCDDVIKVSGYRLSPYELESIIGKHPNVIESSVVAIPSEIKGSALVVFVVLKEEKEGMEDEIKKLLREKFGPIATPERIYFVKGLPKTKTGKIIRKILKSIVMGEEPAVPPTIEDESIVDHLKEVVKK